MADQFVFPTLEYYLKIDQKGLLQAMGIAQQHRVKSSHSQDKQVLREQKGVRGEAVVALALEIPYDFTPTFTADLGYDLVNHNGDLLECKYNGGVGGDLIVEINGRAIRWHYIILVTPESEQRGCEVIAGILSREQYLERRIKKVFRGQGEKWFVPRERMECFATYEAKLYINSQ